MASVTSKTNAGLLKAIPRGFDGPFVGYNDGTTTSVDGLFNPPGYDTTRIGSVEGESNGRGLFGGRIGFVEGGTTTTPSITLLCPYGRKLGCPGSSGFEKSP
ncbi:hypothetical protein DERF_008239 [Dermatophagoides farinae]|uniref:Uncharacterized protein n=1 Tax=Dermatophagoides farinae TaxID=6954 RepID=A0A922I2T0_DERFA|nr:hypothetical protein DERF_008239 [Dermatophagoides farinae]